MKEPRNDSTRRRFLRTVAGGTVVGTTALAGCSGESDTTPAATTEEDGSGSTTESGDGTEASAGGAGEALPTYTYLNNPANYNAARHDAINLIGERLNQLGLDVGVEVFEWGTLYERATQEFDFGFTTWSRGLGLYPGTRMPEQFHSSNTDPGQGNFTGYTNEDLDPVLMNQLQEGDRSARVDMLHEIQSVINEDVPMHPIVQMPNPLAFNNNQVSNWTEHLVGFYHMEPQTNVEVTADHGELRGSWSETLGTLNVLGYNNETKLIHQFEMLYDKLVRNNSNLEPDADLSLATSWESPDETTVRYQIREGHTWHDGEDVTPEDVKFTLDYIKENQVPLYATQWEMYDSVEVDGQWVQVNFSNPVGPVHQTFSNQIPIVPQHIWSERSDPTNVSVTEPVGSGPLMFDYWDQGSELSLVRNDDHWNTVNYDRRIWRIIPESSTVWSLLLDGTLNYLPFTRIGKQLSDNQSEDQITVLAPPGDGWWHLSQNTRQGGLDDPVVRRAAVHSIPKQVINEQLLYGFATQGWNLVGESFGDYSNPEVPKYQEENGVEVGRGLMEEAGYTFDDDGMAHFPE
ncbi:ABC transporter substrate-binding protein [Candidatus Halobonum tyrrellensis]|uniref:ABC transporter substrate-binding protein n=1 Tax=Candidatus Halobonum tyrrellensis G22 TaxID=1324957 RepID=V4HEF6_9EURY|nr:ABC transporter substrate-binding protein [Candidatus Halobonum tyrrellensis]ESP88463.1 ABC transporter substrate-binding protein [Candidatus Halobonum tyrrellensis G22]